MFRRLGWIIAVSAAAAAGGPAPLASALAARSPETRGLPKGDLVVTFSGTGGGSYRFHQPAVGGGGSACRVADATYTEADSYRWSYRFVLPPGGGSSDDTGEGATWPRCTSLWRTPIDAPAALVRSFARASAIATERCLPPVQPMAMVK